MTFWLGINMSNGATDIVSSNIPANNRAILQQGDDFELLPAGQHFITSPNVTLRGLFTLGENQIEMPTKDMCVSLASSSDYLFVSDLIRSALRAIKFPSA